MRNVMRRLRLLILTPLLVIGGLGLASCDHLDTSLERCNFYKSGDHWTIIGYDFRFGVTYCRATTSAGGFDEFCLFPGDTNATYYVRRECDWGAAGVEA